MTAAEVSARGCNFCVRPAQMCVFKPRARSYANRVGAPSDRGQGNNRIGRVLVCEQRRRERRLSCSRETFRVTLDDLTDVESSQAESGTVNSDAHFHWAGAWGSVRGRDHGGGCANESSTFPLHTYFVRVCERSRWLISSRRQTRPSFSYV